MTDDQIALARRAVACKGWRWLPGMLASGFRVCRVDPHGYRFGWSDSSYAYRIADDVLPDLEDHATLGCLLALVREAWADECACVLPVDYGPGGVMWVCQLTAGGRSLTARHWVTEAEALVAALEAAP